MTHAVADLREVLLQGHDFDRVSAHFWVLLGYAVLLVPTSLVSFAWAVRRATRDGTLLQF